MADDLMREIAPLLAEDGIDLDDPASIPDQERLQRALDRAIERRNVALFTPVGETRSVALTTLRLYVEAIASDQTEVAGGGQVLTAELTGHVIPAAVRSSHDQRAHGLPRGFKSQIRGVLTHQPLPAPSLPRQARYKPLDPGAASAGR
jgi:hypothetical protein